MPLYRISPNWGGAKYLIAENMREAIDIWEQVSTAHNRELDSVERVCNEDDLMYDPRDDDSRTTRPTSPPPPPKQR